MSCQQINFNCGVLFDNVVVTGNRFGRDTGALTDWLSEDSTLTSIDLSSEFVFGGKRTVLTRRIAGTFVPAASIALVIAKNKSLTRIELECENRFSFCAWSCCSMRATTADMRYDDIDGIEAIMQSLKINKSLKHINLCGCISSNAVEFALAIADMLATNATLEFVDLGGKCAASNNSIPYHTFAIHLR